MKSILWLNVDCVGPHFTKLSLLIMMVIKEFTFVFSPPL